MPRNNIGDWRVKYSVVDPSSTEILGAALRDRQSYVSGTTTRLVYFSTIPANRLVGNMPIAGQLPAGTAFLVQAIRVILHASPQTVEALAAATDPFTGQLNDLFAIYTQGVMSVDVLNKKYCDYPLWMLPPGAGLAHAAFSAGDTAAGTTVAMAGSWGNPDPRAVYTLAVPFVIPPQTSFPTILEWPLGAVTLTGGNTDLEVVFDGQLARPKQ